MCGIAGIVRFDNHKISHNTIKGFTDTLSHRGPDGSGYYINEQENIALGHRRLSILDTSEQAGQPMYSTCKRYIIVFNGEIFNFIELKRELEKLNCKFSTSSDTEVILEAYKAWGIDCLHKFNGMWALALYDRDTQELVLCRDRFGIKPLYYLLEKNSFFSFASETLAFKSLSGYTRKVNAQHLALQLAHSYPLEGKGHTIYQNVFQLLPGHYMVVSAKVDAPIQKRWWNIYLQYQPVDLSFEKQKTTFYQLFEKACSIRMRSDVPVVTALSGGLDSSSVFCMLGQLVQKNHDSERSAFYQHKAYIKLFPGNAALNEKYYADAVTSFTRSEYKYLYTDYNRIAEDIVQSTLHFDTVSPTPLLVLSDIYQQMAQEKIKVSIEGHGVDEMLWGYHNMLSELDRVLLPEYSGVRRALQNLGKRRISVHQKMINKLLTAFSRKEANPQQNMIRFNEYFDSGLTAIEELSDFPYPGRELKPDELIVNENFHVTELPNNLRDFDRASMKYGVEVRMPFLDYRLVSFVFSLPFSSKVNNGFTKYIVRESLKGILPPKITARTWKVGIQAPLNQWLTGCMKTLVLDTLSSKGFTENTFCDGKKLKNKIEEVLERGTLSAADASGIWQMVNASIIIDHNG